MTGFNGAPGLGAARAPRITLGNPSNRTRHHASRPRHLSCRRALPNFFHHRDSVLMFLQHALQPRQIGRLRFKALSSVTSLWGFFEMRLPVLLREGCLSPVVRPARSATCVPARQRACYKR